MAQTPGKSEVTWNAMDNPLLLEIVAKHPDGQVSREIAHVVPKSVADRLLRDDPIEPPRPSTNPRTVFHLKLGRILSWLVTPISYLLWRYRIRTNIGACAHERCYHQQVTLNGVMTKVTGVLSCARCFERYCNEDVRRICVACNGPIFVGSWVNFRRHDKQTRFVHHQTCSGERHSACIWLGDGYRMVARGI